MTAPRQRPCLPATTGRTALRCVNSLTQPVSAFDPAHRLPRHRRADKGDDHEPPLRATGISRSGSNGCRRWMSKGTHCLPRRLGNALPGGRRRPPRPLTRRPSPWVLAHQRARRASSGLVLCHREPTRSRATLAAGVTQALHALIPTVVGAARHEAAPGRFRYASGHRGPRLPWPHGRPSPVLMARGVCRAPGGRFSYANGHGGPRLPRWGVRPTAAARSRPRLARCRQARRRPR